MGKYLTPETLGDGHFVVRVLIIPRDLDIMGAVNGSLIDLTYDYNWEKQGAQTPEDTAACMETMFFRYLAGSGGVIGSIFLWPGDSIPDNALECDGGQYERGSYPSLYDAMGAVYRVDADHFIVPDLRGRVPIGVGQGAGLSSRDLGDTGGQESVALGIGELPAHTHSEITAVAAVINGGLEAPAAAAVPGIGTTGSAGLGLGHENMPPWVALRWCIWAT